MKNKFVRFIFSPFRRAIIGFLLFSNTAFADKIAFFYAMDADLQAFQRVSGPSLRDISTGRTVIKEFVFKTHQIYATKLGSGCVQSAMSAQATLGQFKCDRAISIGPVGVLQDNPQIGKWCMVNRVVAWQRGTTEETGFIPSSKMSWNLATNSSFPTPLEWKNVPQVAVASGESFVTSDSFRSELAATSGCATVDMNLFGLLTVLDSYKIPSIHFRIISDRADNHAAEAFSKFIESYQGAGGELVAKMIGELPPDPSTPEAHESLKKMIEGVKEEKP